MRNYIKGELYRALHTTSTRVMALIFMALPLLLNIALWIFMAPDFPYDNTSFSFSFIVSSPSIYGFAAFIIASQLYETDRRVGNFKNAIACGISREKIFVGQIIVGLIVCTVILALTLAVYILSALALLKHSGPVSVFEMIRQAVALYPIAAANLIIGIVAMYLFDSTVLRCGLYIVVIIALPALTQMLGMAMSSDLLLRIANWMPENFLRAIVVNRDECIVLWDNAQGLARCLIAGAAGIAVFSAVGLAAVRRKGA